MSFLREREITAKGIFLYFESVTKVEKCYLTLKKTLMKKNSYLNAEKSEV